VDRTIRTAAAAAAAIAAITLTLGWGFGWDVARRLRPDLAAMVPSTALCLMLLGAGVLSLRAEAPRFAPARLCAAVAGLIAAADLVIIALSGAPGIDSLFAPQAMGADGMAFATAFSVLLAGLALGLAAQPRPGPEAVHHALVAVGLLTTATALVGYLFDAQALYAAFVFTAMSVHTALCAMLIFVALLLMRWREGWPSHVLGAGRGARAARRLAPVFALASLGVAWLAHRAIDGGALEPPLALSVLAIAAFLLAGLALVRNAARENAAEQALIASVAALSRANADKALLLSEVSHRVKNNLRQIGAMLRMERRRLDGAAADRALRALEGRVRAMGLAHELLIAVDTPSEVDLGIFLPRLAETVADGSGLAERGVSVGVAIDSVTVHLDEATALGLLVHELLGNAARHAFPHGAPPPPGARVDLSLTQAAGTLTLTVSDTGPGFSDPGFATGPGENRGGTGALIVRSLVQQLSGALRRENDAGARVIVTFPERSHGRYRND
jgi:two-component sensor histidine kinase